MALFYWRSLGSGNCMQEVICGFGGLDCNVNAEQAGGPVARTSRLRGPDLARGPGFARPWYSIYSVHIIQNNKNWDHKYATNMIISQHTHSIIHLATNILMRTLLCKERARYTFFELFTRTSRDDRPILLLHSVQPQKILSCVYIIR